MFQLFFYQLDSFGRCVRLPHNLPDTLFSVVNALGRSSWRFVPVDNDIKRFAPCTCPITYCTETGDMPPGSGQPVHYLSSKGTGVTDVGCAEFSSGVSGMAPTAYAGQGASR